MQTRARAETARVGEFFPRTRGRVIFDGAVSRIELGGEVVVADGGVGAWERVFGEAKGTYPRAGHVVDARVGVKNGGAVGAG